MAKNSQNHQKKQEERVCEKIFRVVTSPVRSVRRISKPSSNPDGTEKNHPADPAHVKFSETRSQMVNPMSKMEASGSANRNKKTKISRVETTVKTDERFADYIKRAKLKIRAMTNVGDMMKNDVWDDNSETETHHDDDHHHHHHHVPISHVSRETSGSGSGRPDQFSDYIKKAKMKLKSSSTIARANPTYDSFKD